ncbi:MAG: DMT family transporter [Mariprofundales bacterium]
MLFLYAATFSFAYATLNTATGALILFGAVQITMIALSVMAGERLKAGEWMGVVIAISGLIYLMLPSATTPSLTGFVLMTLAGIAWGVYSLRGRGSTSPLMESAYNFARTLPLAALLALISLPHAHYSATGVGLAILSGGVASGMGYAIWYAAMGGMSATQAAVVQLLVPLIAAMGGVIWLAEAISTRLMIATAMILGGILMVVMARRV